MISPTAGAFILLSARLKPPTPSQTNTPDGCALVIILKTEDCNTYKL